MKRRTVSTITKYLEPKQIFQLITTKTWLLKDKHKSMDFDWISGAMETIKARTGGSG